MMEGTMGGMTDFMSVSAGGPMEGTAPAAPDQATSGVIRETPDVAAARANLVKQWCARVKTAKTYYEKPFKRMKQDMMYARLGADAEWVEADNYVANVTQRHINQSVASLYAKNPKAEVKRKKRLEFKVWDGDPKSYQEAVQMLTVSPFDPNAIALILDVEEAKARKKLIEQIGKTLEIGFNYFTSEQEPSFKKQMKQLVRRTLVCGVGYLDLGFQRALEKKPEVSEQIADASQQITTLERLLADQQDGELDVDSAQIEELKNTLRVLQSQETVIAREGPVFSFPRSTEIIVDPKCKNLVTFLGADWVAREFMRTSEEIQEMYDIDLKGGRYTEYDERGVQISGFIEQSGAADLKRKSLARTWRVQDKKTGTEFTLIDGYPDFAKQPEAPVVKIERFFSVFTLVFNEIEDETEIYPPSDVHNIKHMQNELNRSRQGLREHKHANRPAYATPRGKLEEEDKTNLRARPSNAIIELNSLAPGEKVGDMLQAIQPVGIDPNIYETRPVFDDILRVVGSTETNTFGVTNRGTATGEAIAESGRTETKSSNVDDLDEFLSDVARATSQVMLTEMSREIMVEIVGPGAIWPELSRDEIAKEIYLDVKAGSSGRPNRAAELANYERGMPFIIQMPGLNPTALARQYLELLEIDVEDAIAEGLPSIVALNSLMGRQSQPGTGDAATNPEQQGGKGSQNAEVGRNRNEPGGQPAFPDQTGGPLLA